MPWWELYRHINQHVPICIDGDGILQIARESRRVGDFVRAAMPESSSQAEEALFIALMCQCDRCGAFHDLDDIDHLADESTIEWANEAVRRVKPLGRTSPYSEDSNSGDLLCPTCSAEGPSAAKLG
jgi:hypothetical protein